MRWKAQLVVLGLNGRIRRTPGYAGGYLFKYNRKLKLEVKTMNPTIIKIVADAAVAVLTIVCNRKNNNKDE